MVIIHKKEKGRKFATLLYANPTPYLATSSAQQLGQPIS